MVQIRIAFPEPSDESKLEAPTFASLREISLLRSIASNLAACLAHLPTPSTNWAYAPMFRSACLTRRSRGRSLVTSALLHVGVIACLVNLPSLPGPAPVRRTLAQNVERTILYYRKAALLPTISPPEAKPAPRRRKATPPSELPRFSFSPSQVIVSSPPKPDNDRQTIVQPEAPELRIASHVEVPNMVLWRGVVVPPRPAVSEATRQLAQIAVPRMPAPAVAPPPPPEPPKLPELRRNIADLQMAAIPLAEIPKLPVPAIPEKTPPAPPAPKQIPPIPSPPPLAPQSGPPVNVSVNQAALRNLISVAVAPAPPEEQIRVPEGNRAGEFAASPSGSEAEKISREEAGNVSPRKGAPQELASRELGEIRVPHLSVTGGRPTDTATPIVVSPPEPRPVAPPAPPAPQRESRPGGEDLAKLMAKATRPSLLPEPSRGRPIEPEFFGSKRVYTVSINMPNLTSGSGSWVLRFAELNSDPGPAADDEISSPVAVRKVDPRYVPSAVRERVEGTVLLAAHILRDGKVSGVRILRGIDPRLDVSAAEALSFWQFEPARKHGAPVDLDVVVQIPFRLPAF
jgi:TonB family protein